VTAAAKVGVKQFIYSSIGSCEATSKHFFDRFWFFCPMGSLNGFVLYYVFCCAITQISVLDLPVFECKKEIEKELRNAGFQYWTIVRSVDSFLTVQIVFRWSFNDWFRRIIRSIGWTISCWVLTSKKAWDVEFFELHWNQLKSYKWSH
jgi:hypothetical protein